MIEIVNALEALPRRREVIAQGSGDKHWCTDYIGRHSERVTTGGGEAFLVEMTPGEVIPPHFHEIGQFQVFVDGAGSINKKAVPPLSVHYADEYTAYGPVEASALGLSYFVLHALRDPGAVYLHKPGFRDRLKPSPRRQHFVPGVVLSTAPVLREREVATDVLMGDAGGPGAFLLRIGARGKATGPAPREGGGQYSIVVNGGVELEGVTYGKWSLGYAGPDADPMEWRAGEDGAEVLILQFPRAG
jgi:hypothetical protein